jgi:hypothetical protein
VNEMRGCADLGACRSVVAAVIAVCVRDREQERTTGYKAGLVVL